MENYQVLHLIGEGCFGKVFKGRRKYTGQAVALKFITTRGKSEKDLKNLRQEMSILKTLNHENIILLIDAFETASDFVVVTEFAHGELFEVFQDDRQLPESEVQLIAQQLVKALDYLHSNRVIHRDMKPQNILIGSNNVIKLCDFGFARAMSTKTTVLNSVKGTPLYMAPELVQEQPYTHTADLWSLGVILYELFVGTPPFYTNSLYSLINLIINDSVKYPDTMSPSFKSFLQGLLQKNPDKRLDWPHLLNHPFVASSARQTPSPVLSAPSTAVSTPRNSETARIAMREIEAGFDAKRPPQTEEIAVECLSVLLSKKPVAKDLISVSLYVIGLLQFQSGDASVNPVMSKLFDSSEPALLAVVEHIKSERESDSQSQLLRLFGLWLRETPAPADTVITGFIKIVPQLLTSASSSVIVNTCKCLTVALSSPLTSRDGQKLVPELSRSLVALTVAGNRSAMHALSVLCVSASPSLGDKDVPSPWAHPTSASASTNNSLAWFTACVLANKDQVVDAIVGLVPVSSSSTSPRSYAAGAVDSAAVQLLFVLAKDPELRPVVVRRLTQDESPVILQALPVGGKATDAIAQCQAAALLGLCCEAAKWATADFARNLANALATRDSWNPWTFSYCLGLLVALMKRQAGTPRKSSRLRESLVALVPVVQSESLRCFPEYAKTDDRRRVEAQMTGMLLFGPLDAFFAISNMVEGSSRRLLRGLMGIAGGVRGVMALCGPNGLLSLVECLCAALTDGSSSAMIKEVLAVLQSVVAITQSGTLPASESGPAFDALLDTLTRLCSDEGLPADVTEALAGGNFVPGLVNAISTDFEPSASSLGVLGLLMQTSVSAVNQFVASRGLDLIGSRQLLRRSESPALIGEVLGIVSSVARTNSEFYVVIHERVSPYSDLDALLRSRDAGLKAKVCSAVGNMARHNAFFYPHLKRLVSALTDACRDSDVNCKKFASFAIGNIAFHSAELYSELKLAIGVLVFLLKDEDEKTRSNAAGALGNLVRNSGVLVPAMIKEGVIEALLALARQTPIDSSGRISLFSLGNLAMHVASKEVLAQCGCGSIVNQLLAASKSSRDAQTVKYCERLLSKLQ